MRKLSKVVLDVFLMLHVPLFHTYPFVRTKPLLTTNRFVFLFFATHLLWPSSFKAIVIKDLFFVWIPQYFALANTEVSLSYHFVYNTFYLSWIPSLLSLGKIYQYFALANTEFIVSRNSTHRICHLQCLHLCPLAWWEQQKELSHLKHALSRVLMILRPGGCNWAVRASTHGDHPTMATHCGCQLCDKF